MSTSYDETHPFGKNVIGYTLHIPNELTTSPLLILCHPFNNSREYWQPQINDPLLSTYPKLVIDALGFAQSSTHGEAWTFDQYTLAIFEILDSFDREERRRLREGFQCCLIGDSMGGGPTGLRVGLLDATRVRGGGKRQLIKGVVAIGTSSEEESKDFVEEYTEAAEEFARKCLNSTIGPLLAIKSLASNMSLDGYTPSLVEPFVSARTFGQAVIEKSLNLTLRESKGLELDLDPKFVGEAMITNFRCLNYRESLTHKLNIRPSPLICQVLVMHGSDDKAYPLERNYHQRTFESIGEANAEIYVVQGGPHFVTVTHTEEVDSKIIEWFNRKCT